ncbi:TMEM254 family protein [Eisenibacter elegans]|jgi:hypothetical protein|uniref:TMEM254 family protein n=1 Tax=Eisenibacter elegans TaxID=997 RepID=UPI0003F6EF8C|nr:DUF4499 domain-containing protein [Eisenibacter elegans]
MSQNPIPSYQNSPLWWWIFVLGGFALLALVGFGYWLPQYAFYARYLFRLLLLVHLAEAVYAYVLASRAGLGQVAWAWAAQTMACGFWALLLLNKTIRLHGRKA